MPTAIEEFLRAYAPVTMARIAETDIDYNGVHINRGDKVLMNFPAACLTSTRTWPEQIPSTCAGVTPRASPLM